MAKQQPIRQCVVCRTRRPQAELIRFWRRADGQLAISEPGHRIGRGSYCCPNTGCMEKVLIKGLMSKRLRATISIEDPEALLRSMQLVAAALNNQRGDSEHGENHG